jgi:hypothetical protein
VVAHSVEDHPATALVVSLATEQDFVKVAGGSAVRNALVSGQKPHLD